MSFAKTTSEARMTPTTPPKARPRPLLSFWDETRLRVDEARSCSRVPSPGDAVAWREALLQILLVGYGAQPQCQYTAGAWRRQERRTAPSAGALYPFEVAVGVVGEGIYLYDLEEGRLVAWNVEPLASGELTEMGLVTAPGHEVEAILLFMARPWLSMEKYRLRGYTYCHLDVGHAATNLGDYAAALGWPPTLHLRFSRRALIRRLSLDGSCREPLLALCFGRNPSGSGNESHTPDSTTSVTQRIELESPSREETENWESLRKIFASYSSIPRPTTPCVTDCLLAGSEVSADSLVPLPAPRLAPPTPGELRSAIVGRRSAKGFRNRAMSLDEIGQLLAALRTDGMRTDCGRAPEARLGVRVVARNVDGIEGIYSYSPREHALHRIDSLSPGDDPRRSCMHQELAGDAAVLVLFYAPIRRLLAARGYGAFAELHFYAAQLAQRLYTTVSRLGTLGMTCIGGFDEVELASLGRLEAPDEAVYVVLAGVPDDKAVKHDRAAIAYSHGHAT